ncbi:hypothetical protein Lsed01_01326 [Demequina sediminis]|uniref:Uncharacterized protein n=2 Tax=Demequina sediminis TaxID=1930058 RepID=A0ABP9WGC1_9MICO
MDGPAGGRPSAFPGLVESPRIGYLWHMPRGDAKPLVGRRFQIDSRDLPRAFAHDGDDPLRAHAFWTAWPRRDRDGTLRAERIGALARLSPRLRVLAEDPRPELRVTYALCFSILAWAGRAPSDREVWRTLLGLSKYDDDPAVRAAAEEALAIFERLGTVARDVA